jgi:hypothetical protein
MTTNEGGSAKAETESKAGQEKPNVRCSYCGNDTECMDCQRQPGKENDFEHICFDCYQNNKGEIAPEKKEKTHVCIPQQKIAEAYERFLEDTTKRAFNELWEAEKKKMRELSKQELAEATFFEGARFMYSFMQKMAKEQGEESGEDEGHEGEEHSHEEHSHGGEKGHSHEGHSHEGHSHEGHKHEKK